MTNRRTVFARPADLVGAVDMSELLRDANGEVYQVGGLIHDGGGQRYLEMFGTEYEIIPGGDYGEAIVWPLRLVQVVSALDDDERRSLAHRARQESDEYADPRYHKDLDVTERRQRSDRWREIADAFHPDPYGQASTDGVWFIARCVQCSTSDRPLKLPFRDQMKRDEWAAGHEVTGHTVQRYQEAASDD